MAAPFGGAYSRSPHTVKLTGDATWRRAQFPLPQARLLHSQNREADLRLVVQAPKFAVQRVTLHLPRDQDGQLPALDWSQHTPAGLPQ